MNTSRTLAHVPQLDSLRALAVIGVLISHFGLANQLEWLAILLPWGHFGVRLFFVLSGFLITRILLERRAAIQAGIQTSVNSFLLFYGRRFLRIFPVFYLTIFIAYVLDVGNMRDVVVWHIFYLSNLNTALVSVIDNGLGVSQHVLRDPTSAHFWSLAVEEQFYLIWPALVLFTREKGLTKVLLIMIAAAPVWRAAWFLYYPEDSSHSLLACLDSLGVGGLLALYMQRGNGEFIWLQSHQRMILVCGVILLVVASAAHMAGILFRPRFVLLDIGEAIVFAFIVARVAQNRCGRFAKFLQWKPLRYIGKISYGIYVYHAFMSPLKQWVWLEFGLPDISQSLLNPLILTIMTIATAMLSWHLIEKPLNRLKRYIPRGPVADPTQK